MDPITIDPPLVVEKIDQLAPRVDRANGLPISTACFFETSVNSGTSLDLSIIEW